MTSTHYAILGYAVVTLVLWGYALSIYMEHRRLARRERIEQADH